MSYASGDMISKEVMDVSELKDGQMKEVELGPGKVLVSMIKGEVRATSAFCTHVSFG